MNKQEKVHEIYTIKSSMAGVSVRCRVFLNNISKMYFPVSSCISNLLKGSGVLTSSKT